LADFGGTCPSSLVSPPRILVTRHPSLSFKLFLIKSGKAVYWTLVQ
jgi:hypothetical protein